MNTYFWLAKCDATESYRSGVAYSENAAHAHKSVHGDLNNGSRFPWVILKLERIE